MRAHARYAFRRILDWSNLGPLHRLLGLFFYLMLHFYYYNMYVESLPRAILCLVMSLKLGPMFAIWKIPPATRSRGKQNVQFQNIIDRL